MTAWARPGVKCVCINDDWVALRFDGYSIPTRVPMINEVLTVASVERNDRLGAVLTFVEIDRNQVDGPLSGDVLYSAACFRPLITQVTKQSDDVALFTHHFDREGAFS